MIEELYRKLIENKINPTPDTLRMYMRGEKTIDELQYEYPLQFDTVKQRPVESNRHNPFRSIDIKHFDDVPDDVLDAYNRIRERYYVDGKNYSWSYYEKAKRDRKDDIKKVQDFLKQNSQSYDYEPDKDYYGVKAYQKGYDGELLPFFMDVEDEDVDIHHIGKRTEHDGFGRRGGFSINAIPREFNRDEAPFNHTDRILYSIDDPGLKKELLEKELKNLMGSFNKYNTIAITKSKGEDILPSSSVELVQRGLDPQRDYEEEAVVKGLTPVETVPLKRGRISKWELSNAAADAGMSIHDFIHSKHVIPFLKSYGLKLDDIKDLDDLEKLQEGEEIRNINSNARKVMERLMSRGYDNIISDEHLKIKERFL